MENSTSESGIFDSKTMKIINRKGKDRGHWVLGMGDLGLGIVDCAHSPIPNPQSPIPNPQDLFNNFILIYCIIYYFNKK